VPIRRISTGAPGEGEQALPPFSSSAGDPALVQSRLCVRKPGRLGDPLTLMPKANVFC